MTTDNGKRIVVDADGPYLVYGDIPLVRKTQVVSEYGEPLTWRKEETIETSGDYELCRCGQSDDMPFCDKSHRDADWDGTETADTGLTAERQVIYAGGTKIVVKRDHSLCMEAGFCGMRLTNIKRMVGQTDDTQVRSLVMAMIERCPSGSYTLRARRRRAGHRAGPAPGDRRGHRDHLGWPDHRPAVGDGQHPDRARRREAV